MGRWRPPREESSPYITPEGAAIYRSRMKTALESRAPHRY
ncbi:MAG: hypothetical protein ACI9D5_000325 [Candidatus Endobugula sp.]|jgi:hypothetical protein